ncbi:MAG: IS66 family transposase [Akkermansiaceae bacterium]|nr:IS66 family transposase [Akkermansiaceae bacterium]MCF7731334.1 IS66 family transposase [Akkermansiaceae bacterium]
MAAIQRLYQVETSLRQRRAAPDERFRLRQELAAPVLLILKGDLVTLRQRPEVLPKSLLGKAIDYTLTLWDRLNVYLHHGQGPQPQQRTTTSEGPGAGGHDRHGSRAEDRLVPGPGQTRDALQP